MIRVAPPLFPRAPPAERYLLQLELTEIDATRSSLSQYRGFRNFIVAKCNELSLVGYIWRVPINRARILVCGTEPRISALIDFCNCLLAEGYMTGFFEQDPEHNVLINQFVILPSSRRFVRTGLYSDPKDDDVVSKSSGDTPILQGPKSPHGV